MKISLISLHGLIRGKDAELGRDADTGGQVKYVLELAEELSSRLAVERVELITRQIFDSRVSKDYSIVEEPLTDRASIVRIPFGPKRYLRKEELWPYMETFIDQMLSHYRRVGLPDLIHGHYADAGYGGAQLSRLLHVPFVFTGHSLGRVKRQRLIDSEAISAGGVDPKYNFTSRVEAEEMALETASLVITSTAQEVEEQYEIYDHYQPDRMEVIPPGISLNLFRPPGTATVATDAGLNRIRELIVPFLREPDKPIILTMARPDERKNLEMLVRVFGQSEQLQKAANLVMVMGTRNDLRELPTSQRQVIQNVLLEIDRYNLYGKVAYPKAHMPSDVPDLYRFAAAVKGVFINPALTEPFGLTLLEAAASGVPIVATNDGGPKDIIANCKNGLLVDPLDRESIEHGLMRALTETKHWDDWASNGVAGVHQHYTWQQHVDRYLRDVSEIVERAATPALANVGRGPRRLPEFDRMIITDLDNTLTGDDEALAEFIDVLNGQGQHVGFGIATGRRLDDALELIGELGLPRPDVIDCAVGTELYYGANLDLDRSWRQQIAFSWTPKQIKEVLADFEGLYEQEEKSQSEFKISYGIDPEIAPTLEEIQASLREAGLRAKCIYSLGTFLDVVPMRGGSELSIRHLAYRWGFEPERLLIAGDSGNDEGMLKGRTLGVVVGNYSPELEKLRGLPRIYFAEQSNARGILEGIEYYNFFDHITISNDGNQ